MSTTYNPDAGNNPATITLPSDLDDLTAEAFNVAYRALGDKVAYALATRATIAAINEFTRVQKVEPPTEDEACLLSRRFPGQITADNRWTLVFKFYVESDRTVRMYTGGLSGVGRMAWVMNANWNVTDQLWELEDTAGTAAALIWSANTFTVHSVPAGASPWLSWPTVPADGAEAGSLKAAGEFRYAQTKTRTRTIPLATCAGAYSINGGNGSVEAAVIGVQAHIRWPIRLPPGAVIQSISILHHIETSAVETFKLTRRRPVWDPGSLTVPSEAYIVSVDSDSGAGDHITTITTSTAVDKYDDLTLLWIPSAILLNAVHGITITWADQGPTPI